MDGELALCPKAHDAHTVLDMGTGTGQWAMDYGRSTGPHCRLSSCTYADLSFAADLHPSAQVRYPSPIIATVHPCGRTDIVNSDRSLALISALYSQTCKSTDPALF